MNSLLIQAVAVNHNTSAFAELMLRSLLTMVMRTHGLRHARSFALVLHFFCASYTDDRNMIAHHTHERDRRLAELRVAGGA